MTLWVAGAGGILLFLMGSAAGKISPVVNLMWLAYNIGLLGLTVWWLKHLAVHMDNLLRETPGPELAKRLFPVRFAEFSRVDRDLTRLYRKMQLAEFAMLNQKARQAGENFDLMLSNTTDPLTVVPNRRELDRYLDRVTGRMRPMSVIMMDIDHFKKVNDTYGHESGDLVLQQFSSTVKSTVRPGDFLGRYGGEEFMVVCNAGLEEAAEIAERVRVAVRQTPLKISDSQSISITASFGVAEYLPGEIAASVVRRADRGLYAAKQAGRNRVERGIDDQLCAG